jgi:HEXXH motif-containing protein
VTNGLDRFVAPQGDPETIRRLSWRRSALRLNILLASHRERPREELAYLLVGLERVSAEERHRALAAPETALYIEALLNDRAPNADIGVPVLTRIALASSTSVCQKFSWSGRLPLDYLPLGAHAVRAPGEEINDPELLLDGRCIRLSSPSGRLAIQVPVEGIEAASENCSLRAERLELIDGWAPFRDDFDDGNMSVNLEPSARVMLSCLLAEAVTLIGIALPAALEEMLETAQYLSPIRPKDISVSDLPSFSSPALPGVIFVGVQQGDGTWIDGRHLAESCVHEHLHNRLYLLDEALPLTIRTAEPQSYYSPWKRTMRGIDGMLHAIYVFSHLAWFWRRVGDELPELEQYAARCVEEQVEHLETAVEGIGTSELTEAGHRVLQASTEILHTLTAEARTYRAV